MKRDATTIVEAREDALRSGRLSGLGWVRQKIKEARGKIGSGFGDNYESGYIDALDDLDADISREARR